MMKIWYVEFLLSNIEETINSIIPYFQRGCWLYFIKEFYESIIVIKCHSGDLDVRSNDTIKKIVVIDIIGGKLIDRSLVCDELTFFLGNSPI